MQLGNEMALWCTSVIAVWQLARQVLRKTFRDPRGHFNCNGGVVRASVGRLRIFNATGDSRN
jgi:hypothetical protein